MNLDSEELKATKENQEKYTITVPLFTNQELEEIGKHYNDYIEELVKAVTHDKDLIVLQEVIKEQKRRIEKQSKVIDEMADKLSEYSCWNKDNLNMYKLAPIEEIKQYFYRNVENENSIKELLEGN